MKKISREQMAALHEAVGALFNAEPEGPEMLVSTGDIMQAGVEDGGPGFMSVRMPRGTLEKAAAVCAALDDIGLQSPVHSVKIDGRICGCSETLLEWEPEDEDFGARAGEAFAMPAPEDGASWERQDAEGRIRSDGVFLEASAYGIEFKALPKYSDAPCFFYMDKEALAQALEACPAEEESPGMRR